MFGRQVISIVIGIGVASSMGILLISVFFYAANAATSALPPIDPNSTLGKIYYKTLEGFQGMATYLPLLLLLGIIGLVAFIAMALYQVWERGGGGGGGRTRQLKLIPYAPKVYVVFARIPARFFYWF